MLEGGRARGKLFPMHPLREVLPLGLHEEEGGQQALQHVPSQTDAAQQGS
jgi:hypothetical protein